MLLPPYGLSAVLCTALTCWWPQALHFHETNWSNTRVGSNTSQKGMFCLLPHFQFSTWDGSSSYSLLPPCSQKAAVLGIWWARLTERCSAVALEKVSVGTDILFELVTHLIKQSVAVHSCQQRRYFTKTHEDAIVDNYGGSVWQKRYLCNFR